MNLDFKVDELAHGKQKIFKVSVIVNKKVFGEAEHTNKKQAEQQASEKAIELLKNTPKDFFITQERVDELEEVHLNEVFEESFIIDKNESTENQLEEVLEEKLIVEDELEIEIFADQNEAIQEIKIENIDLDSALEHQTEDAKANN
jgi:hypothetical protein